MSTPGTTTSGDSRDSATSTPLQERVLPREKRRGKAEEEEEGEEKQEEEHEAKAGQATCMRVPPTYIKWCLLMLWRR